MMICSTMAYAAAQGSKDNSQRLHHTPLWHVLWLYIHLSWEEQPSKRPAILKYLPVSNWLVRIGITSLVNGSCCSLSLTLFCDVQAILLGKISRGWFLKMVDVLSQEEGSKEVVKTYKVGNTAKIAQRAPTAMTGFWPWQNMPGVWRGFTVFHCEMARDLWPSLFHTFGIEWSSLNRWSTWCLVNEVP